jgi:transposase
MLFKGSPAKELKKRNKLIIKLIKKGVRKEQIAVRFDIGISRVYQIWNKR